MADKTKIEWSDATWNIITGCTLVDDGCKNCYAAHLIASWPAIGNHPSRKGLARKNAAGKAKFTGEVRFNEAWLDQPLRWKKPRRIFVCAHGDLFHHAVPDEWIDRVFAVMALCPQHTFQLLTKRPERACAYLKALSAQGAADRLAAVAGNDHGTEADPWVANFINGWSRPIGVDDGNPANGTVKRWPLPNVWLGTSISDQSSANERLPYLLDTPAAVRFLSVEPMLGPVDLTQIKIGMWSANALTGLCAQDVTVTDDRLSWVICGGESGPGARPMHPDWARSLRDQCVAAGVPFFFKQWGKWLHESQDPDGRIWDWSDADDRGILHHWLEEDQVTTSIPLKGKSSGRLLDGRTWDEMPGVSHG